MNILLMGARGCGKTTLGRAVALRLTRRFVDLDERTLAGFPEASVAEVWAIHGETAWRSAEADALDAVLSDDHQIIALGGGTPTIPHARARIDLVRSDAKALCIYLYCHPEALALRLSEDHGDRPSLTGAHPADEIASVLAQREQTYRELADYVLDVTELSLQQAVDALAQHIRGA